MSGNIRLDECMPPNPDRESEQEVNSKYMVYRSDDGITFNLKSSFNLRKERYQGDMKDTLLKFTPNPNILLTITWNKQYNRPVIYGIKHVNKCATCVLILSPLHVPLYDMPTPINTSVILILL